MRIAAILPVIGLLTVSFPVTVQAEPPALPVGHGGAVVSVVADGLHDPRGLVLGEHGEIYVAEAGTDTGIFVLPKPPNEEAVPPNTWVPQEPPTQTRCEVYFPVGPATPGYTGRISRIDRHGVRTTVAEGLPSFASNLLIGGDRMGIAAMAFAGERLFALQAGGGCSHGHPSEPNALLRIEGDGTAVAIADLSNYLRGNTDSKDPADGDFEPDGTWYSLVRAFGGFYAVEPNRGVLIRIDMNGAITPVADLIQQVAAIRADSDGDQTYPTLIRHKRFLYVATLGKIPNDFEASVYRISPDGTGADLVASGLHGVLGLAFDRQGHLYALETTTAGVNPPLSDPSAGRLVRVEPDGSLTEIVTGLAFPTSLITGRNGEFYISNCGYHCDDPPGSGVSAGAGQVLRVRMPKSRSDRD